MLGKHLLIRFASTTSHATDGWFIHVLSVARWSLTVTQRSIGPWCRPPSSWSFLTERTRHTFAPFPQQRRSLHWFSMVTSVMRPIVRLPWNLPSRYFHWCG